ncbi:MAG: hypothetical protein CMI31_09850 [Opitutae bacterium]|nr:hypothetical protein [Opitutae bacterium]
MITFSTKACIGRRSFLRMGSLGLGGFSLAQLLRAESRTGVGSSHKAVIHLHLDGGPPQMDLIDPKPDAPAEIRGPFAPIPTKLDGLQLTELLPKVAGIADRFAFIRSLVGAEGKHDAFQCQSGFSEKSLASVGGRPAMGCVVEKLLGLGPNDSPAFVDLMQGRPLARNSARPGFLGAPYKPFRPNLSHLFRRKLEDGMKGELARLGEYHSDSLSLVEGLSPERLDQRLKILRRFDKLRLELDNSEEMMASDAFNQRAVAILTSGKVAEAIDLSKEDPSILERYTPPNPSSGKQFTTAEGPLAARKLLIARRLVEAGVRCVSVSLSDFDTHSDNFPRMRHLGPILDHALWALVTDLEERGMLDDVTVLAWGEFGRTPKVNAKGGRDHWPKASMGIMAGGGMQVGQVIGATDKTASEVTDRPIHYQDVMATLYHNLGINPSSDTITDLSGRPRHLLNKGQPIRELVL